MGSATAWARLGTSFSRGAAGSPSTASAVRRALCIQCWRQRLKLCCNGPFFFFPFPLNCQA